MSIDYIFVYGKLRNYYIDESLFEIKSLVTLPVQTSGKLYEYNENAVLIKDEKKKVYGNLLVSTNIDQLLRHTDLFMEFNENDYANSKYIRVVKNIYVEELEKEVRAWCYVYPSSRREILDKNGKIIENGNWMEYLKVQEKENDKK